MAYEMISYEVADTGVATITLDDPDTVVIDKLLVQAWGRKPAD